MCEVIKFNLSGPSAVIRKPDSNTTFFSYNNVHKIMILGILGAIIGENGYNYDLLKNEISDTKHKKNKLPDFYENLKDLKIAVIPYNNKGVCQKKIQTFNNSVGYASKEEGNNLVVKEQYLENPSWDIYILSNKTEIFGKIKEYLINRKCEYIPYIGKNEHFASIDKVEILEAKLCDKIDGVIDSIFTDNEYDEIDDFFNFGEELYGENDTKFEYRETLPTKLDIKLGYKDFKEFVYTNKKIKIDKPVCIYKVDEKNIFFF